MKYARFIRSDGYSLVEGHSHSPPQVGDVIVSDDAEGRGIYMCAAREKYDWKQAVEIELNRVANPNEYPIEYQLWLVEPQGETLMSHDSLMESYTGRTQVEYSCKSIKYVALIDEYLLDADPTGEDY